MSSQQSEQVRSEVREQPKRRSAGRKGVAPSSNLRPYFVSLARQVQRWADKADSGSPVSIGVTSLNSNVGRSTVSFNLASALNSIIQGETLLVEADFGKHYITRRLGKARSPGLAELLLGYDRTEDVVFETPMEGMSVVGCGRKSGQEALELPFDLIPNVIGDNFDQFSYAVFDLPVASHLTACFSMANHLDGLILVVEAKQIDQRLINRFRKQIESFGTEILGVVLNKS